MHLFKTARSCIRGFVISFDCFLRLIGKDGKNGGPSRGASGVVRLADCNDEVANHLIDCHLSEEVFSEKELILARTGLFNFPQEVLHRMWIRYRHRHMLGKFWRSYLMTYQYPEHSGDKKRVRGRDAV